MKKRIALLLVLSMLLCLWGCDSADYKKAMELYDNGEFAAAKAMFAALGAYEDSTQMVAACDYQQALVYMEDGQYQKARELLVRLGNHADSPKLAVKAAQYMLIDYVQQRGETVRQSSSGSATSVNAEDGKLYLVYTWQMTGLIESDVRISGEIDPKKGSAAIAGTDITSSDTAHYRAQASCRWDIHAYESGEMLEWETFHVEGTTAQGTEYTRELTMLHTCITMAMQEAVAHLEQLVAEAGFSMGDIGFAAY